VVVETPGGSGGSGSSGVSGSATPGGSDTADAAAFYHESGAPPDITYPDVVAPPDNGGSCFCTRRPGPGVSLRCPAGIDESAWAIIGPAGGTVALTGRQGIGSGVACQLTIAPKAIERDVAVSITETSIPPPKEFSDWSPIYEVAPACVRSSSLMKLRLPWGNRDGLVPSGLTIYYAKDRNSPFQPLSDVYNNAGFSDAGITEFGLFFVGVPKSPDQAGCP
jgi:hypothetical protein